MEKTFLKRSIFVNFDIIWVMMICLLGAISNLVSIKNLILSELVPTSNILGWWIAGGFVIVLFGMGWHMEQKNEKIGWYILGIDFILEEITILMEMEREKIVFIRIICLLLTILAAINFWKCYDKHFRKYRKEPWWKPKGWLYFLILWAATIVAVVALGVFTYITSGR